MELHYVLCDSCGSKHTDSIGRFSNGRGEGIDLCDVCVRKIILKALKSGLCVIRSQCYNCSGKGVQLYNKTWLPCGHCSL
jgi:hypothetical protein